MRTRTLTLSCTTALAMVSIAQSPSLVKDINPNGDSNIAFLTCHGDAVYFRAVDDVHGTELWKSDGTGTGTVLVKDINPGAGHSSPTNFMEFNGMLHFTATDGVNGLQIWRTDGTANGTVAVLSLGDVPGLLEWGEFAALGDRIFFRGYDAANGRELWSTDGTSAGTQLFLDIHPGTSNSGIDNMIAYNGHLYFKASDSTHGAEPWISDGTVAGTRMIAETMVGTASPGSTPGSFFGVGDLVFFRAGTSATGDELWVTDGTAAGTALVRDIYPGINSSLPSNFLEHNGVMHLRAYPVTGSTSALIYSSDGTQAGTTSYTTYGYLNPDNLCSHNGQLYFTAITDVPVRQLWRTDGTAEGTTRILYEGSDVVTPFGSPTAMVSCNGTLYFRAKYMAATGQEFYALDQPSAIEAVAADHPRIHPNPASTFVSMDGFPLGTTLRLFTMDGRLALTASRQTRVDISALPTGVYAAWVHDHAGRTLGRQLVVVER